MTDTLISKGYTIVSGGTDNHLCLVDLKNKGVDGARLQIVLDFARIYMNKNSVPGDKSALVPGGMRLGAPSMTTRGLVEKDFVEIAHLLDRGVEMTKRIKEELKGKKLAEFKEYVMSG